MSLITSSLKHAISFVSSPWTDFKSLLEASARLLDRPYEPSTEGEEKINRVKAKTRDATHPFYVNIDVQTKIENFLKNDLKLDPSRVILLRTPHRFSTASAQDSLKYDGAALLFLSSQMIQEIKEKFTAKHRFIIAHEVGHMIADDTYEGKWRKGRISTLASLATYGASLAMLTHSLPIIPAHLLSCIAAKGIKSYTESKIQQKQEFAADLYAASQSADLAQGGHLFYSRVIKDNLNLRNNKYTTVAGFLAKILFSPEGNDRLDFDHPPLTERIALINPFLKEKTDPSEESHPPLSLNAPTQIKPAPNSISHIEELPSSQETRRDETAPISSSQIEELSSSQEENSDETASNPQVETLSDSSSQVEEFPQEETSDEEESLLPPPPSTEMVTQPIPPRDPTLEIDVALRDFQPVNTWKVDLEGPRFHIPGEPWEKLVPRFLIDQETGRKYLNESKGSVRQKCALLALATPIVHAIASLRMLAIRIGKLLAFYPFWAAREGTKTFLWKERVWDAGKNLFKLIFTPLAIVGLQLSAIYGLFSPYDGRKLYASFERTVYGKELLAPCFQPEPTRHAFGGDIHKRDVF